MELKDWIKEKGWSITEFAKRAGICRGTAYVWLNKKKASKNSVKRLKKLTNGKVNFREEL